MDSEKVSQSAEVVHQQKPYKTFSVVMMEWLARFTEHYRQPISKVSADTYREGLSDLTPSQVDAACREALRTSEFMPTVATIQKAHKTINSSGDPYTGRPEYLDEPPLSEEDREAALEFSKELRAKLGITAKK